jgi:hypothetical protein
MIEKDKSSIEAGKEKTFVKGLSFSDFGVDGNPSVIDT